MCGISVSCTDRRQCGREWGADGFKCDFESKSWCGISQSKTDNFDWTFGSGPTPSGSKGTGPNKAHSGKYYVFAEASKPQKSGNKAVFELPKAKLSGTFNLEFQYVMRGRNVRQLKVVIGKTRVWSYGKDTKSPSWKKATVSVELNSGDVIKFVAERGNGYRADIAVDDIILTKGVKRKASTAKASIAKASNERFNLTCDFEKDAQCFYIPAERYFSWHQGCAGKGPIMAAASGSCYLYVDNEALNRFSESDSVWVPLKKAGNYKVSFEYNLKECSGCKITIYVGYVSENRLIWEMDDKKVNKSKAWNTFSQQIKVSENIKHKMITFKVTRNHKTFKGAVGIDDVKVSV